MFQELPVLVGSKSAVEQPGRAGRLDGRPEDGGKVPMETRGVLVQFTFFGSDHADRFVTMSNCLSKCPINCSAFFERHN